MYHQPGKFSLRPEKFSKLFSFVGDSLFFTAFQKFVQVCHFVVAIVPLSCVIARPVKTSASSLNVFMGSMAMPHERCL